MKGWTKEEIERLKRLATDGLSDGQIAIELHRSERAVRAKRYRTNTQSERLRGINSANAQCPYFENYGNNKINCMADDNLSVCLHFNQAQNFKEFAQKICQNDWQKCFLSKAITERLEGGEPS